MKDFKELQKELKESKSKIKNIEFTSVELLKSIFDITNRQRNLINEILKPNKNVLIVKKMILIVLTRIYYVQIVVRLLDIVFLMNYRNGDVVC